MIFFFVLLGCMALAFIVLLIIPLLIARLLLALVFLIIAVPAFVFVAYWYLGGAELVHELTNQRQQLIHVQAKMKEFNSPAQVITAMKAQLQAHPEDAKAWYLLGKLYLSQQDYVSAADALAKANHLEVDNPEFMTSYAEALFFLNNRSLSPQIAQLLNKVLAKDPNNIDALNLFAIGAYNAQEYRVAIRYWQHLLVLLSENSEEQKSVIEMIDRANKKLTPTL